MSVGGMVAGISVAAKVSCRLHMIVYLSMVMLVAI